MTDHEREFNQWKKDTRREALEKEVERLTKENRIRGKSIVSLRIALIIIAFLFFAGGLLVLFLSDKNQSEFDPALTENTIDTTNISEYNENNEETIIENNSPKTEKLKIITPTADTSEFSIPEDRIFFSVQIGAYLGVDLHQFRKNLVSLHQDVYAEINQFTLGVFPTYSEAQKFREIVQRIGFQDAYIVAFEEGHRINIQDALKKRAQAAPK